MYKGDKDLKYLKDVTRSCWFYNEVRDERIMWHTFYETNPYIDILQGKLKWTKYYNHLTCFNECQANYILKICGCIPFYYPLSGKS